MLLLLNLCVRNRRGWYAAFFLNRFEEGSRNIFETVALWIFFLRTIPRLFLFSFGVLEARVQGTSGTLSPELSPCCTLVNPTLRKQRQKSSHPQLRGGFKASLDSMIFCLIRESPVSFKTGLLERQEVWWGV